MNATALERVQTEGSEETSGFITLWNPLPIPSTIRQKFHSHYKEHIVVLVDKANQLHLQNVMRYISIL